MTNFVKDTISDNMLDNTICNGTIVKNICMDSSGTHTKKTSAFDVHLSESPVNVKTIPVVEDKNTWELFLKFHLSTQSNQTVRFLKKIRNGIKS